MKATRSTRRFLLILLVVGVGVSLSPEAACADELDYQDNNVCAWGDPDIWGDICWGSGGGGSPTPCKKCQRCSCAVGFSSNCASATCC